MAAGRVPHLDPGQRPRRPRDRVVPRPGRRARDAVARAVAARDRRHRRDRRRDRGLRPWCAVLLLLGRLPAVQHVGRSLRQPWPVRPAVSPALRPAGPQDRQARGRRRPRQAPVPQGRLHRRRRRRAGSRPRRLAEGRGSHEGPRLRPERGERLSGGAGRPRGQPRCARRGRRGSPHEAQACVQPRLYRCLPARHCRRRDDELRAVQQPRPGCGRGRLLSPPARRHPSLHRYQRRSSAQSPYHSSRGHASTGPSRGQGRPSGVSSRRRPRPVPDRACGG